MGNRFELSIVVATASLLLAGCTRERRDCVDEKGQRLPDSMCTGRVGGAGYPRFIYGGSVNTQTGRIVGGSTTPRSGFGGSSSVGG